MLLPPLVLLMPGVARPRETPAAPARASRSAAPTRAAGAPKQARRGPARQQAAEGMPAPRAATRAAAVGGETRGLAQRAAAWREPAETQDQATRGARAAARAAALSRRASDAASKIRPAPTDATERHARSIQKAYVSRSPRRVNAGTTAIVQTTAPAWQRAYVLAAPPVLCRTCLAPASRSPPVRRSFRRAESRPRRGPRLIPLEPASGAATKTGHGVCA